VNKQPLYVIGRCSLRSVQ